MLDIKFDSEEIEVSSTLIKILRKQVLEWLKGTREVGEYIIKTEDVIKHFYTPYLVSLLTSSYKNGRIDVKSLKYNFQYMITYFSELHKYSLVILEYGLHQKLENNESIEIERQYDTPLVVNKNSVEFQEFAEKFIEVLGFNKRVNLAFLEKLIVTKINKKAFKLVIKHSYQMPVTLIIPIPTLS